MKKLFLSFLILYSIPVVAKPVQPISDEAHEKNCRQLMLLAELAIDGKQKGMPLSKMLQFNDEAHAKLDEKDMHEVFYGIVVDAYKQPTYTSTTLKKDQFSSFSSKYYLACIEMYK